MSDADRTAGPTGPGDAEDTDGVEELSPNTRSLLASLGSEVTGTDSGADVEPLDAARTEWAMDEVLDWARGVPRET